MDQAERHSLDDVVAELGIDEDLHDRMTIHIAIDEAATREEADAFFDDLAEFVGEWMEAHPERGQWDPSMHSHTESCDDSDHCHGPGSWVEKRIAARTLRAAAESTIAETVCCDEYERSRRGEKRPKYPHHICYWGAAHAEALTQAADSLEPRP